MKKGAVLDGVVREGFSEEQRPDWGERTSTDKNLSEEHSRQNSKDPEACICVFKPGGQCGAEDEGGKMIGG